MRFLLSRLREPSTYAGIAALLGGFGLTLDAGIIQNVALAGTGLAGLAAAFMPEGKG